MTKPTRRPANPCFSSGPCAKRPGWSPAALSGALLGRSHRSKPGVARLAEVIERSRAILQMPADYRLGIVAGSDTGAVELALWSLLGARGIDLLSWENFGEGWVADVTQQLKPSDVRVLQADYGLLPDFSAVVPDRDTVFVGPDVCIPIYRAAAVRAEMKVHFPPFLGDPGINFFRAFHSNLRLLEVYARVHDGTGPALAGLAMTNIHGRGLSSHGYPKGATVAARLSFHDCSPALKIQGHTHTTILSRPT